MYWPYCTDSAKNKLILTIRLTVAVSITGSEASREDICYHIDDIIDIDSTRTVGISRLDWIRCRSAREYVRDQKDYIINVNTATSVRIAT